MSEIEVQSPSPPDREFEVILWGASGFTGRLVAEYLLARYGGGADLRWALAGRSRARLEQVRDELGPAAGDLPILLADSADEDALDALAARTRVICTTVGPYAAYGSALVAACVGRGTHYCDLTGEVHWMRRMIDLHHDAARASGARIVHTCGFDSIPSDLGVYCLQQEMVRRHGVPCAAVRFRAREFKGGFSGGTVASMLNMLDEAERDPGIRQVLADPYGLNPPGERRGLDGPERMLPVYDAECGAWVTPFVMGVINTKVVRRSNALLNYAYGHDFRYEEGTVMPFGALGFPLAAAFSTASAAFAAAASVGALRRLLAAALPKPGEGPSERVRATGFYLIDMIGRHPKSRQHDLRLRIRGDRDPGYGSTAKMLAESAVCLARDPLTAAGGVLTPAVAMGEHLLARLGNHAGVAFEFV